MTDVATRPTTAAEPPSNHPELPALGIGGTVRYLWTQLTSMRTALVLLFALAVAAIPGSLVPQRSVSPFRVEEFITEHPVLGPAYDQVGLFNVYTSPWFSAIYLLLFLSLIGCIIPRIGVYARAVRSQPPRTPRNLARLPAYASVEVRDDSGLLARAADELKAQRYRVVTTEDSVSAERGYLREAGNLVFHVSLLVLLLGIAIGAMFGFRGTSVVIEGQGFSNNLTQYDDITAGSAFRDTDLVPFTVAVQRFEARFESGRVQRGAARLFRAEVQVTEAPGGTPVPATLEVNHPLKIDGTSVHLIGHGYAPRVTVRDGSGNVAFSGPAPFLPQDGNFTSAGVIKAPDGRPNRLAFEGFFTPTAVPGRGPTSAFPDALIPMLYLNAWSGPPKVETGRPENVYSLDTTGMTQLKNADGSVVAMRLNPGDVFMLPDGQGSVQLDGWVRWVKLQVGNSPGAVLSLTAIGFAVLGLCLSLFVRPRRVWVRIRRPASEESTQGEKILVEVAGLDRADARAGLSEDVAELAADLTRTGAWSQPRVSTRN
ncbi:MAG TPA: cytochrome c biogenesis protein ResB [Propionibacteriaceae bacterium]|nr:cytochrome c biogenesis protein ResB [Propionibacteriaceae bacterium]